MSHWQFLPVPFKFQLSDLTLFSVSLPLQVRAERLLDDTAPVRVPMPPVGELLAGSQGFVIHALPLAEPSPPVRRAGNYLCYVPQQYEHCYIDLGIGFERYQGKFSAKTRATILRKVRKYAEHCGGAIAWQTFRTPDELARFFRLAGTLSKTTYQERLLDAGLPDSDKFRQQALVLAGQDRLRAYLLYSGERPVAYLFCPVEDEVLSYAYVGYDPAYIHLSVGTVLQWLAIEQLFGEARFRYFDFTEGQSEHKRLFATDRRLCGKVFLVKRSLRNCAVIHCHRMMNRLSSWLGAAMARLGLKARVKRVLRFVR
ncbi:GNAT family N-acetyltransferase [Janthinobacterium fluminis]|uniref:GNAT family N-acetyltransferase n=1 Tax=Janthinobacterium fluminis TaxID=2987524 RepID=A0ABT5K6G5_9BURK|nr:GNAT family N-acetyltransferase [Janthinobacterium fluminis]MDC8760584.1 GNAT family N-acetyltransferase [Janthinobacterium fluminis]